MSLAADLRSEITVPVLANDGLEIIAFTTDPEADLGPEFGACLSKSERRRAEILARERDRRRFTVTRGRLRHLIASRLGIAPANVELEYGLHGKPRLSSRMSVPELHFSVSRSEDLAVIALSTAGEIGVDIEAVRPVPEADDIAFLCFSEPERESYRSLEAEDKVEGFLRCWTRLEATSKALGCGLGQPVPADDGKWAVRSFVPEPGYIGTVVFQR